MMERIKKTDHVYNQAYEVIRSMIIKGEIPPGQNLVEEKLASSLGVSRTPIRESLRRLQQEGLIQGKRVVQPTKEDMKDIYEVRMLVEGHAAKHAAVEMSDSQRLLLIDCISQSRNGLPEEIMKANTLFHDTIMQASHNNYMLNIISQMKSLILLFRHQVGARPCLCEEHEKIYESIMMKDGEAAEHHMRLHLQHNLDFLLSKQP
ncbi:GntR family transcriptional regulator [Aneurinibacillus sp. Ricciae_BoGa-3]|uniref:GntR family transcriptional regulator n=1 Tax=Aneurinibacillus sp. Ricciae_BoGa-3 TaxID=3022697 RepID=UPI00233FF199|nr:GntR family transcriptional regulator [Aneurinibacillus sp. Ricciae_BoGa-3]WCK54578.1 GntR family transcriptional regulator [Aneurinibacillus sp. Ricciae_BoGa-3]